MSAPAPQVRHRPDVAVHLVGTVFLDIVFAAVNAMPRAGTEVRSRALGTAPGGVANTAVALCRLGASVSLSAAFGDDAYGGYLASRLDAEGVDLSSSRTVSGWVTPVTASIADGRERALVTHETDPPLDERTLLPESLDADALFIAPRPGADLSWCPTLPGRPRVYLDAGLDGDPEHARGLAEQLPLVDVFLPNAEEARTYSGATDVRDAARALGASTVTVVKDGADGAIAAGPDGIVARAAGVSVEVSDTTGAGDVFDAGLIYAGARGLQWGEQLAFANLCAALSLRHVGGSLAAPCWEEIATWHHSVADADEAERYAFLRRIAPGATAPCACHRAAPTLSRDELTGPRLTLCQSATGVFDNV